MNSAWSPYCRCVRRDPRGDVAGAPRRLWVTFDRSRAAEVFSSVGSDDVTDVLLYGCGVTGLDADDCWRIIRSEVFGDRPMPEPRDVVFDIDVSTLDPRMVLPRIGNPSAPGVWFPARNL